jgi:hypothetical protein
MKSFKTVLHICAFSFRKLRTDYRLWISVLLLLIFTHMFTKDYGRFCSLLGVKMSPWIFPFLYDAKYLRILFFIPLLLLFCDAPFIDRSQPYVIYRSGRVAWSVGQLLYITLTAALYFAFLLLVSNLFNISHVEFSLEWGKVFNTLANTSAAIDTGTLSFISSRTLFYFTPLQATWFTFLLSWLAGTFLGLILYAVNSLTNTRSAGIVLAAFFLVLDSATELPSVAWLSPVSWSSLAKIDIGGLSSYPSISYVLIAFTIILGFLAVLSIIVNKRQQINVMQPV